MAVVTRISARAQKALDEKGIRYGYVYRFSDVPGASPVDIDAAFTLGGIDFLVEGEHLLLADEKAAGGLAEAALQTSAEAFNKETQVAAAVMSYLDALYWHYPNIAEWEQMLRDLGVDVETVRGLAEVVSRSGQGKRLNSTHPGGGSCP